jgi:formate hydrogenlyase transcriptional activator
MQHLYSAFPQIIACTSIVIGILCLMIAVEGRNRKDLTFSLAGLFLIVLFIIPPQGFLAMENSAHWPGILAKRIAISIFYLFAPWYLLKVTCVNRPKLIATALFIILACYAFTYLKYSNNLQVFWIIVTAIGLSGLFILGLRAAVWQYRQTYESSKVRLFVAALSSYQLVFLLTTLVHVTRIFPASQSMLASSMYGYSLVFVLTIMVMLAATLAERSKIEKALQQNARRIQSVMENAPVIVLELDREGGITYVNDFGAKLLGYENSKDVLNVNWFSAFLLPSDIGLLKKLFVEMFNATLVTATFKNTVRCKNGNEIIISWVNFLEHEPNGKGQRVISIGRDISNEETANKLVAQLQKELAKENISLMGSTHFELEENIVGKSKAFTYAIQRARQVANTHAPVLLEGETGVGKEVFANLIHRNSSRSKMPFIKVNCGALPKELIEDELFGHEKGAFTSAIQARKGRFELADNGTIFLDEIGELPLEMQPKLLRVLQNGEFERVGGQKTIKVDVRILAATNRNLSEEITKGNFREDLYYRLNVFPMTIPPLRNRQEDLPALIQYFIATKCKEYNKVLEKISTADMQRLMDYRWPGNIRELKNVIERAVIVSEGHLFKLNWWHDADVANANGGQTLEEIERDHILTVMEKCRWKINGDHGAAEILNLHPNTLRSKMKRLGILRPQWSTPQPEIEQHSVFMPKESLG